MSEQPATGDWLAIAGAESADWPAIPGYEVRAELGRGGMGIVYKAWQASLKRLVALKMLRSGGASADERRRFAVEAEAASRLQHPNVVAIYEVGAHSGQPYFAMEFVDGGGLHAYLSGRPQRARQAADLVHKLALAVQHAHDHRIVHRDLKPANILLARKTEPALTRLAGASEPPETLESGVSEFEPKIADFGLAKRLDAESTAWTRDGAVLGTAGYMAPEQAAGRVRDVGPSVDIYALGAILYELLTGRPPFQGDSWDHTVQQVLHDEPVPPMRLQPDLPHELETVCLKCLEKDPAARYATAGELAADLTRFLEGSPVYAVPQSPLKRLARLAARDGYHIVSEVGRGPRSTVYQARHEPLKHFVALKVFSAGVCSRDDWEARLRRGSEQWAALAHPHIMPVQRAGWWDDAPFVALEFMPQGSLAAKISDRSFPIRQALRLVEQLADIVAYLHRQGVVHGNLKPTNILLAADGIPRVSDFSPIGGLFQGRLVDDAFPNAVGYLAPELLHEVQVEPRPYTDVYGLGLILYELLTGRPPFQAASAGQMVEQVRDLEPEFLSGPNPELPSELARFCLVCLRKNPWRRFVRAHDVATGIRYHRENLERQGTPSHTRRGQDSTRRRDSS
jgi:serine/threonine protein kinase